MQKRFYYAIGLRFSFRNKPNVILISKISRGRIQKGENHKSWEK